MIRNIAQTVLFLLSLLFLLALLTTLPIAMFAPARFAKPWMAVSLLTAATFICAVSWLLLGWGC